MGLIEGLQSGKYQYLNNSNANITIKTGDGNNNINIIGGNANIATGNGNQNISAMLTNNLSIQTGTYGNDVINASAFNAMINTSQNDDTIQFTGTNFDISALDGNKTIAVSGNLANTQAQNSISIGNGDLNRVSFTANNVDFNAGNGNLNLIAIGNNSDIDAGNGNHTIIFEGDNVDMNLGYGNNNIASLDFAIASSSDYNSFAKFLDGKSSQATTKNVLINSTTTTKQIGQSTTPTTTTTTSGNTRTTTTVTTTNTTTQDYKNNTYADETKTTLNGNKNVNINTKDGNNNILVNANNLNINTGKGNNNITAVDGIVVDTGYSNQRTETVAIAGSQRTNSTSTTSTSTSIINRDPLIIDFNQDGIVSATQGKGVDLDGNGTADGAAISGDKMLAMSDLNGNEKIDGQEVFGDRTVDPFTGKALNAGNGFEALKSIAESAQEHTNIKCIDANGLVDLKELNRALQTIGVKLGFVSDNNTAEVEDLSKVAFVNTKDYKTTQETGNAQHNQQGTSIFEDGTSAKTDNVWFELTGFSNPFDFSKLKNLAK